MATKPTGDIASARAQLLELRTGLIETAREHDLLVLASGTQPLARWELQQQTRKERYDRLMQQMQMLGQRNVVCGMHVHVEVPRPAERVDLMNRMLPFTPLLLALSASSPFWQGRDTGLAAYRLSVWGEMPRTGLPDLFVTPEADHSFHVPARSGKTDAQVMEGLLDGAGFLDEPDRTGHVDVLLRPASLASSSDRGTPVEALAGLVERVTFHNSDTGFCVLRVKGRGQRDLVTVVGHAASIAAG